MNVFDIIGPVMIGPSSSHTAGAVRLGRVAYKLLGTEAVSARIELTGSFAQTYRGHGTDKALVAGIMGMDSDDERIRRSLELAAGFAYMQLRGLSSWPRKPGWRSLLSKPISPTRTPTRHGSPSPAGTERAPWYRARQSAAAAF